MLRLRNHPIGLEPVEAGHFALGDRHLAARQIDGSGVLVQFLVNLLNQQAGLIQFPLQPLHLQLVVARIDTEQHGSLGDELAGLAGGRFFQHSPSHFGSKCYLPERHHNPVGLDVDAPLLGLD